MEIDGYVAQLEAVAREAREIASPLDAEQLAWRPAPGRWSVAECLAHLAQTARAALPAIDNSMAQARERGWLSPGPFRYGLLGNWFVRSVEPPPKFKVKTPLPPVPVPDPAGVLEDFLQANEELIRRIRLANGLDLKRAKVPVPGSRRLKLSLGQGFALMAAHSRRHLWQARQVLALREKEGRC